MSILILVLYLQLSLAVTGQSTDYNFRHLNATQGLADGVVDAIGQDKYGYIWIGTMSGLSRFDGYTVQAFYNDSRDSTSLPFSIVQSILSDRQGRLWIGCYRDLVRFDYASAKFLPVQAMKGKEVVKMIEQTARQIFIATNQGLALFNPLASTVRFLKDDKDPVKSQLLSLRATDMFLHKDQLYLATDTGLLVYDTLTQKVKKIALPSRYNVKLVAADGWGNIWFASRKDSTLLIRTDSTFGHYSIYSSFVNQNQATRDQRIVQFLVDRRGELWFTTSTSGVVKYDYKTEKFILYKNNPLKPSSIIANHATELFQDKHGFVWIGTEGNGVDYFHPDQNFIQVLLPGDDVIKRLSGLWARCFLTDKKNNYWMGMSDGLIRSDASGNWTLYQNTLGKKPLLQSNSIRSLMQARDGRVWIGTASGINWYDPQRDRIEFPRKEDSLPNGFCWAMLEDSRGDTWFGFQSEFYFMHAADKNFHSMGAHPFLSQLVHKGVRSIFEDSKHRLWFGMNGSGVVMYDPASKTVKSWMRSEKQDTTLISNTITSIAEDRNGMMWFSSFTGLTYYDPKQDHFGWFTQKNGLASLKTSALLVDARNRLWIGSTKGLLMLDSSRKNFKNFDLQDGLLTMEFTDMPAYKASDGRFIYPTLKGFIIFDPLHYREDGKEIAVYLTGLKISGSHYTPPANWEELSSVALSYDQNFFSLDLTAFNYSNPEQTWYAYKLDPFDKDWVYTKNKLVNYTNVPGGNYVFHYKASGDPANWHVPEKSLSIKIGTVFYKAPWFWIAIALLTGLLLYRIYRYRIEQQRRIFSLQNRAQTLEKEKAVVMFESLKQQLNPHFLFNSLTSLGSLIRIDPKMAGEFLEGMSKMYRYILKNRDHEVVSLSEEILFAKNYVRLQTIRFERGLEINIDIPETYHNAGIAPVTLQNLIENAIKHNCIDAENPLVIHFFIEDNYLVARNNLQKKSFVDTSNKQGLANLRSLYSYLSGYPILIREDEQSFTIKIPLL
ncbi:MAG: histidine kinase [Williamsia sp.]|nr:histidine kinase [Williamsia sp.]